MATPSGFLQTLLGAFTRQSSVSQPNNRAMEWVTMDIGFNTSSKGAVVNIPISVAVDSQVIKATGVGYVAPTYNDYAINNVPITLDTTITYSVAVPSIDELNTDQNIMRLLVDPALKAVENKTNGVITALCTTANFGVNTAIPCTNGLVTTDQFIMGKTVLEMQNVDTEDTANIALLQAPYPYNKTLTNAGWSQESIVGEAVAFEARARGVNRVAFGASMAKDQLMPVSGTNPTQIFTAFYGSRDCIAAAYRPVPLGDSKYVDGTYIDYKGMIFALEVSYNPKDKKNYMNLSGVMGAKVIRPDRGILFTIAQ